MANEINISANISVNKGGWNAKGSGSKSITMSGADMLQDTQDIGTSAEAVTWGEITGAPKYVFIKNLDSTNYVTIGWTNPPTEIPLLPGEIALFPTSTATFYALANTATVKIGKVACEA